MSGRRTRQAKQVRAATRDGDAIKGIRHNKRKRSTPPSCTSSCESSTATITQAVRVSAVETSKQKRVRRCQEKMEAVTADQTPSCGDNNSGDSGTKSSMRLRSSKRATKGEGSSARHAVRPPDVKKEGKPRRSKKGSRASPTTSAAQKIKERPEVTATAKQITTTTKPKKKTKRKSKPKSSATAKELTKNSKEQTKAEPQQEDQSKQKHEVRLGSCHDRWFPVEESLDIDDIIRQAEDATDRASTEKENCCICLGQFGDENEEEDDSEAVSLPGCLGFHAFHRECIAAALRSSPRCPVCSVVHGEMKGTQPEGTMHVERSSNILLDGHSCGTLVVTYSFPNGVQGPQHPNPGVSYTGTSRTAYLPDNDEGHEVLYGLQRGFDARVLFYVGQSITTGRNNTVVWNIHHKTNTHGGPCSFGYPDPTYLDRVRLELLANGVKF